MAKRTAPSYLSTLSELCLSPRYWWHWIAGLLVFELVLNIVIVNFRAYTEIDWIAYMQEVGGMIQDNQFDYTQLRGDTGPLVYPAGFMYIFSILYWVTGGGSNIALAQYIFIGLYMVFIAVVFLLYRRAAATPPYVLLFLCVSRRIHSIFALRLFNDCFAMLFLYSSMLLYTHSMWWMGSLIFCVALSVKMNVLLFVPPLALLLVKQIGARKAALHGFMVVAVQLCLAIPFLLANASGYFSCAFNFGRKFFYIWTVNWKMLDEDVFLSDGFAKILLILHVSFLLYFLVFKWLRDEGGVVAFAKDRFRGLLGYAPETTPVNIKHMVLVMFVGNFIGIVFCRSLHYQFYVWYYHTLPFLLWNTWLPTYARIVVLGLIEFVWNVFPASAATSSLLLACHLLLLVALSTTSSPTKGCTYQEVPTTEGKSEEKLE